MIPGKPGHGGPENPRLGAFSTGWAMRNVYALPEFTPQVHAPWWTARVHQIPFLLTPIIALLAAHTGPPRCRISPPR